MRILAAIAVLTGCYSPSYDNCALTCAQSGLCPSGFDCIDGVCRAPTGTCMGGDGDGGVDTDVAAWKYSKQITITSPAAAMGFPVPIRVRDGDLQAHAQASGGDIRFALADTTLLPYEIEQYDSGSGLLVAWVKVPTLSASAPTTIEMLFGNPSARADGDPTAVWDLSYLAVYHLDDFTDATSAGRDGVSVGGTAMAPFGAFGSAQQFWGTPNAAFTIGGDSMLDSGTFTFEAWVKIDSTTAGQHRLYTAPSAFANRFAVAYTDASATIASPHAVLASASGGTMSSEQSVLSPTKWQHVGVTLQNGAINFYVDGVASSLGIAMTNMLSASPSEITIGGVAGTNVTGPTGTLDEVRLSRTTKPPEYFRLSYELGRQDTTAFTVGPLVTR